MKKYCAMMAVVCAVLLFGCGPDRQPQAPFTGQELEKFLKDATEVNRLIMSLRLTPTSGINSDTQLKRATYAELQKRGWEVRRFYYIFQHGILFSRYLYYERNADTVVNRFDKAKADGKIKPKDLDRKEKFLASQLESLDNMRELVDTEIPVSEQVYLHENIQRMESLFATSIIYFPPNP